MADISALLGVDIGGGSGGDDDGDGAGEIDAVFVATLLAYWYLVWHGLSNDIFGE